MSSDPPRHVRPLVPRHAAGSVLRDLTEARVVLVNGPRQAGKTTLLRDQIHPRTGGTFTTLDDEDQLQACLADPLTFIDRPSPLIIDEFQRAGDRLLLAIKSAVDADPDPGRFLLAGSTRFLTVPHISESLAGRVRIVDLWPFTQGETDELGPRADCLVPALFDTGPVGPSLTGVTLPTRAQYLSRVCRGGYPEAQGLQPASRRRFFGDYVRTVTQRDVPEISRVRHIDELPRALRLLAALTGQEVKDTALAERLNIDRRTLRANYLPLLHTVYLALEVPSWSRNLVSRMSKQAKNYLVDSGLAAHLVRIDAERLAEPTSTVAGALVETFVANELIRQVSRHDDLGVSVYHYRAHTGSEVDLILEADDGRVVGVEVKAGASVRNEDFRHLIAVRDRLDQLRDVDFVRGIVLHTGASALSFGDRLEALPLAALWVPQVAPLG